ncbi:Protein MraZ [Candidatus Bandiella woodruffii]|uniref:Transcriptional regulator MraZ n=2 Tax=Candidatus Bandiella euplotis TaxID=1664265 RepID=A0ABZ0UQ82_9RICK|nr:Protein MraZ [Candidatus Bandiella woodruffii]
MFLSTYEGKIDDKNRISIPASFRNVLDYKATKEIYAYSSFINECIEVCTFERISKLQNFLDGMDIFSGKRDAIATAVLADCEPMQPDSKGRVSLPERLVNLVGVNKKLLFVGKGVTFEIWDKEKFNSYYQKARAMAKETSLLQKRADAGQ